MLSPKSLIQIALLVMCCLGLGQGRPQVTVQEVNDPLLTRQFGRSSRIDLYRRLGLIPANLEEGSVVDEIVVEVSSPVLQFNSQLRRAQNEKPSGRIIFEERK